MYTKMEGLRAGLEGKHSWLNQQNERCKQKYHEKNYICVSMFGESGGLNGMRFSNKFSKNSIKKHTYPNILYGSAVNNIYTAITITTVNINLSPNSSDIILWGK